jgi:hypothetical protein
MGQRRLMKRFSLASVVAVAALIATSASPAGASITIGQLAPETSSNCRGTLDRVQGTVTSGNTYVVPGTGTITSWSTNAKPVAGQQQTMKVFRPLGGASYMVVGHDGPRGLTGGTVNTFPANVAVKAGDVVGLNTVNASTALPNACLFDASPGDSHGFRAFSLADGESGIFEFSPGRRVNVLAVFVPSNSFTLGKAKLNKKKGTATLTVDVPNPGELTGSGKGVKVASAAGAVTSKTVTAPGKVKLTIKAKGKKKGTLNETGKVKVKPKITYTPTGGDPTTQSIKVKLKKNL